MAVSLAGLRTSSWAFDKFYKKCWPFLNNRTSQSQLGLLEHSFFNNKDIGYLKMLLSSWFESRCVQQPAEETRRILVGIVWA